MTALASIHGALLGRAIARLAAAHRLPDDPDPCATCGLREGTLANMTASTQRDAMQVLAGVEGDAFGCHHGMKDGQPTRMCACYVAARRAEHTEFADAIHAALMQINGRVGDDPVAAYAARWRAEHDPEERMNAYQLARLWERTGPHEIPGFTTEAA